MGSNPPSAMRVRPFLLGLAGAILFFLRAAANSGDVENSRDYPGFARMPGYVITDYDEDNPGDFVFPVSNPSATDASHIDPVPITGHRYRIRYELAPGATVPSVMETQEYYEKLAAELGFGTEKSGAVGDVSETFHRVKGDHAVWAYLEPSGNVNVLTFVEVLLKPNAPIVPRKSPGTFATNAPGVTVGPALPPGGAVEAALVKDGHVSLPLIYVPGQPDLDPGSLPMIQNVAKILQAHTEWHLVIEGHTDGTGYVQDNQFLSAQRARAVRDLLVAGGVEPTRLTAIGLGGSQPVADDRTEEGREQNRRTDLIVRKD